MKKSVLFTAAVLSGAIAIGSAFAGADEKTGAELFKEKCGSCHPDGNNKINPKKPIKDIKDKDKIVAKIRKGGNGMTPFTIRTLSDADARHIADYVDAGCGQ